MYFDQLYSNAQMEKWTANKDFATEEHARPWHQRSSHSVHLVFIVSSFHRFEHIITPQLLSAITKKNFITHYYWHNTSFKMAPFPQVSTPGKERGGIGGGLLHSFPSLLDRDHIIPAPLSEFNLRVKSHSRVAHVCFAWADDKLKPQNNNNNNIREKSQYLSTSALNDRKLKPTEPHRGSGSLQLHFSPSMLHSRLLFRNLWIYGRGEPRSMTGGLWDEDHG